MHSTCTLRPLLPWKSAWLGESTLFFLRLFCMLLLAGLLLWILISSSEESIGSYIRSPSVGWATLAFVVLTAGGVVVNLNHFAGQFDNYGTR